MDDDLQSLEAELNRLRPVAPSRSVERAIARDLTESARRRRGIGPWLWAAALPAAAAIAIVAIIAKKPVETGFAKTESARSATDGAATFKPVAAENVLYAARDEGLVTLDDGTTARRARLNYVDTITWRNPRTNASLTWTVPREEVRLVPVNFQ